MGLHQATVLPVVTKRRHPHGVKRELMTVGLCLLLRPAPQDVELAIGVAESFADPAGSGLEGLFTRRRRRRPARRRPAR